MVPLLAILCVGAGGQRASVPRLSLLDAVKSGDGAAIRALLEKRADVNVAEPDGTTALHRAVQRDDVETVERLIRAGAAVKTANRYGVTPLIVACTNGNAAIIGKLLDAGADANSASPAGETALMTAARTGKIEAVKLLVARGAHVNAKESVRGQSALMWAAAENNVETVKALVEAGADVTARSNGGFTPLLFAVRSGKTEAVRALLESGASAIDVLQAPDVSQGTAVGTTRPSGINSGERPTPPPGPRGQGPQGGSEDPTVAALLQVFNTGLRGRGGSANGTSALVLAIVNAHYELAALLLDKGADPNAAGQGWTALHQLAWTRRPPIQHGLPPPVQTGTMDSLDLARKLLERGANPNARMTREPSDGARNVLNRIGSTPLLQAAKLGDAAYMRLLVEYGADASLTTIDGTTPLAAAAGVGIWQLGESAGTNEEVFETVKLAYELGNDVNAVDVNGYTALHGAAHRGANEIVRFLVEKGAKLDVVNRLGWTPYLIADGVFYPNTYNRRLETAALLLKLGADPKAGKRRPVDFPPGEEQPVAAVARPR
jgi:ankyrin repeat protein